MKKILYVSFLTLVFSCTQKSSKKEIEKFNWLVGSWQMKADDVLITEDWSKISDSLLQGKSDFIKNDTVNPFETIQLIIKEKKIEYIVTSASQINEPSVTFTITSYTDSGFVAENKLHDFPKRISYNRINKDSIKATIDGGETEPLKKEDFYYSRKIK